MDILSDNVMLKKRLVKKPHGNTHVPGSAKDLPVTSYLVEGPKNTLVKAA